MPILKKLLSSLKKIFKPKVKLKKFRSNYVSLRGSRSKVRRSPPKRKVLPKFSKRNKIQRPIHKPVKLKVSSLPPSSAARPKSKTYVVIPKPAVPLKKAVEQPESGMLVGEITHFFPRIQVAVIKITKETIRVGDSLNIRGRGTNFIQAAKSIQIENDNVRQAKAGQVVGLKLARVANVGDKVFKRLK